VEGERTGEVVVAGLVVGDSPVHVLARETGLVFQDPDSQFCTLTVEDEVAFGLENLCTPAEDIEPAIDAALAQVGLPGFRQRRLDTLSGGEKQRIALAAVLAMGSRTLVLDEPSANLDPRATAELFAIIIVEHKLDQIIDWVDRVLVLGDEGTLLVDGDPWTVFYQWALELEQLGVWRPQTVELVLALRELGWEIEGSPLSVDETVAALAATPGLLEELRTGGSATEGLSLGSRSAKPGRLGASDPVVRVERLSHWYPDGHKALNEVSMALQPGAFAAVAGGNGAGKTTLASLLAGLKRPPAGTVFLEGRDVTQMSRAEVNDQVGLVFQNPEHQFVTDTVFGELAFSLAPRAGRRKAGKLNPVQQALVKAWLERLGLSALAEANPFTLSQGQKRRLSVGSMLVRGQSTLILDEPTIGQDELQCRRLMRMMNDIRIDKRSVLMITHDMRLVAENAGLLIVLSEGGVVFAGAPRDFFSDPQTVEAVGLTIPLLSMAGHLLHQEYGVPAGLHTLDLFVRAAGGRPALADWGL
jgi:energy-coupling factor transport system ATP-binding protein